MTESRRPPTPRQAPKAAAKKDTARKVAAKKQAPIAPPSPPVHARKKTKPAVPPRPAKIAPAATSSQPVLSTRIVARPPSAPRESGAGEEPPPSDGRWSRVAIVTSSQIRTGPRNSVDNTADARSPFAQSLHHSKAAVGNVTHRVQERLRERSKAKHRVVLVTWVKRAAIVAVVVLAVWLLLLSPLFALDLAKVDASGYGTVVAPDEVDAVVATYEGTSLALLNTTHLANELRDVPGVRSAHIEREWPAGLAIVIESREPVAAVPDSAKGFVLIDDEGVKVGKVKKAPKNLPVILVPVGEDHVRVLTSVLGVLDELPPEVADRVRNVKADTEDSVSFTLRKGPRVEWGSAEQSALKAKVLQVFLASDDAGGVKVIDVSAPTLPITSKG